MGILTDLRNKRGGHASPRVKGGHGRLSFYKYYRSHKGKLLRNQYWSILRELNKSFVNELILTAEDYTLPAQLGKICFRKAKHKTYVHNGKLIATAPINWQETMDLWERDPRSAASKLLIRFRNLSSGQHNIRIMLYNRRYFNNEFFAFWFKRSFKRKLHDRIVSYKLPKIEVEKFKSKTH